ncbi:MAG: hypothetical protein K6C34_03785 [Alphaproteobacteria bacterium]|nr:hypothetical protein [Alphaproteobacteria bacterium]
MNGELLVTGDGESAPNRIMATVIRNCLFGYAEILRKERWEPQMVWNYSPQFFNCRFDNTTDLNEIVLAFPARNNLPSEETPTVRIVNCHGECTWTMTKAFLNAGINVELYGSSMSISGTDILWNSGANTTVTCREVTISCRDEEVQGIIDSLRGLKANNRLLIVPGINSRLVVNETPVAWINEIFYRLGNENPQHW